MFTRVERKLGEMQRWVDAVDSMADWPAALALSIFRSRPADGTGLISRSARQLFPQIWVRPAKLGGLAVRIDPSNMSHFVVFEEVFMQRVYDLDMVPFLPDAILDCGAFEGYFSLLAAARFPGVPIIAFEPNAQNLAGLRANMQRNHLIVDARAAAVSTKDGVAGFAGAGCGGHLSAANATSTPVAVIDLRRLITELDADRLLIKMDIEGEEGTLLPALMPVLPRQCAIYFEWHQGRDTYEHALASLSAHGFATSLTRENRVDDRTTFIDAFACRH